MFLLLLFSITNENKDAISKIYKFTVIYILNFVSYLISWHLFQYTWKVIMHISYSPCRLCAFILVLFV